MKRGVVDFETVRRVGGSLPGVEDGTAYGMPALKVGKKILAAVPANQSVEAGSLMVRVSAEQRDELVAMEPAVYYVTEHYEGYDAVLVRLSRVNAEVLKGLLLMAHRYVTKAKREKRIPAG